MGIVRPGGGTPANQPRLKYRDAPRMKIHGGTVRYLTQSELDFWHRRVEAIMGKPVSAEHFFPATKPPEPRSLPVGLRESPFYGLYGAGYKPVYKRGESVLSY